MSDGEKIGRLVKWLGCPLIHLDREADDKP